MDSYLQIAQTVLRNARRPLSPKSIITSAYRANMVPPHLYGKTQHKTLQARLSEDIVKHRENSLFFRTAPGRFFLREFLTDTSIPEDYRTEVPTRRRVRELLIGPALAVRTEEITKTWFDHCIIDRKDIAKILSGSQYSYDHPKHKSNNSSFVWSFVAVVKGNKVLSYRLGKYRAERDSFIQKRTIGFTTLVHRDEINLFNAENFGIVDSGIKATMIDLDMPLTSKSLEETQGYGTLRCFLWLKDFQSSGDLLAIVQFHCPDWFEPLRRRIAMNDMRWLDLDNPTNDIDDFDPWSKQVLQMRNRIFSSA